MRKMNEITSVIINASMRVHTKLGPGLLESTYESCLCHELAKDGIKFKKQVDLPIIYDGIKLNAGYRLDMLVEDDVVVEIKSIEKILPLHYAQLLTYLKLSGKQVGLLLNFNVVHLKDGIKRLVNNFTDEAEKMKSDNVSAPPPRSSASSAVKKDGSDEEDTHFSR